MATNNKYDRQLRLWGQHGQDILMNSHILLINADGAGSETLKNLVLPGVGHFTILDNSVVTASDLACNFFVDESWVGKPRGEAVKSLLCEMNTDVTGHWREESLSDVLSVDFNSLLTYSLVIASNIPETLLLPLADLLWSNGIPLIFQQSFGLLGWVRLQTQDHHIIESKPDNERFDLRIGQSFTELEEFADSVDLPSLESNVHSHVPFIVLLAQVLAEWRKEFDHLPKNNAERDAFKAKIAAKRRDAEEVNFIEAQKYAYMAYTAFELPFEVSELLDRFAVPTANSSPFEFCVAALHWFWSTHGAIPLNGKLPDMTSTTEYYLKLQKLYHNKAEADMHAFKGELSRLLEFHGKGPTFVTEDYLQLFCKNILNLRSVSTRSISEEWKGSDASFVQMALEDEYADSEQTPISWYLSLRAAHSFYSHEGRWPGSLEGQLNDDSSKLDKHLHLLMEGLNLCEHSSKVNKKHAEEIVRFGGVELHNISAVIGGIASQEAVKLLTKQYLCMNNTYIFNGIAGCGCKYEL